MRAARLSMLLRTIAVRLALLCAAIAGVVLAVAAASVGWLTHLHETSARKQLITELHNFRQNYLALEARGVGEALTSNAERLAAGKIFSLFIDRNDKKLGGNLLRWPQESSIPLTGRVDQAWIEDNAIPIAVDDDEVYRPVIATQFAGGERLLLTRKVPRAGRLYDVTEYLFEVLSVALLLAIVLSITVAHLILRRMNELARTANDIMAGDLTRRVPVSPEMTSSMNCPAT